MITIQDQVTSANNCKKRILNDPNTTNDLWRKCQHKSETIQHINVPRRALAQCDYIHRHYRVSIVHQDCVSNVDYKIYCHKPIITDRTIHNNRPHRVILAYLIDVAISNSHNLHSTITATYRKYRHLAGEVKHIAIEKDLYNTTSTNHNEYYCRLHRSLKLLNIRPALHILMEKAVIHNTYMPYSQKFWSEQ
jgi:hypothetical protein